MPDPLEELARFGAGLEGGDMPLSAPEVRRRGDRIRRRRNALVAGGVAVAVTAVAVPVLALASSDTRNDDRHLPAEDPTGRTGVTLSEDDLLTDDDTEYFPGTKGAFRAVDTQEGDGQAAFHPCQQSTLADLGAVAVRTRTFEFGPGLRDPDAEPTPGTGLVEAVAEFPDADAARIAYETFTEWVLACEDRLPYERAQVIPQARTVDLPRGDAVVYDVSWGPAEKEIDPYGDSGYINETGLVLLDDRIAVLSLTIVGTDYNFVPEEGGTPVNRMVPPAAERLQEDG
ncbi:hypothetical protein [Nocardioides sp. SYSU DS0651]|uniref:hypothetical protein n=1 Tax=Nocardioides sp. SYSU DS0651 TaxID=3415955 RepID=UPI003F4BB7AE